MLRSFLVSLFAVSVLAGCQNKEVNPTDLEKKIFARAMRAGDPATAISAAYRIVLLDPEEKLYYDSIANLYFAFENYFGAIEVTRGILRDHKNVNLFKILAYSEMNLGNYTDASLYLQDLLELDSTNHVKYLYDIGTCYYNVKNFETSFSFMKKVMDKDASRMQKKTFAIDAQGGTYDAYYYVAALNTMGAIYIQDGRLDDAEKLYVELFKADPDFPLARGNYNYLLELKTPSK